MVLSGTSLNYLIGLGSIILLLGVIIAAIPLTGETGNAAMCHVSNTEDLVYNPNIKSSCDLGVGVTKHKG